MDASLACCNLCATTSGYRMIGAKTHTPTADRAIGHGGLVSMGSWGQPVAGFNQAEFGLKSLQMGV